MDIRNWSLDRIMQLPDCCFGRRWPIYFSIKTEALGNVYLISEIGLPETCVLWGLYLFVQAYDIATYSYLGGHVSLALGDNLPATDAEFVALEQMFPEADEIIAGGRVLSTRLDFQLRKPYNVSGRRVVVRVTPLVEEPSFFSLGLVFSSIPTEVPDWLISG